MVAYVHIEYSTYQFSEESKGGMESTPPPLMYRKKRGPERVKEKKPFVETFRRLLKSSDGRKAQGGGRLKALSL